MKPREQRNDAMSEAIAEPVAVPVADAHETPPEAFEALYRRSFGRVYGYVATMLHDRSAAEEVTAQAFERAYRNRRSFRSSRGTQEAWLFGIARNAALDELRRRKRRATLEVDPEDVAARAALDQAEDTLRRETVRAAVARLDPKDRELVALKFAGGLANDEIARVVGISPSNVGTRLHRTMERLRRDCDEDA